MMTSVLDADNPDDYWNGMTVDEFMIYLDSLPEYEPNEATDARDGQPWPGSIETRSWLYDYPMYDYDSEVDDV